MAETLSASQAGRNLVYHAIRRKGWTKTQTARWWEAAQTSQATLKRFWQGAAIDRHTFQEICRVAGVNWEEVKTPESQTLPLPAIIPPPDPTPGPLMVSLDCTATRWVGRTAILEKLTASLAQNTRILSIVGITGIGKTSLAQQLLTDRHLTGTFPITITISFNRESPHFEMVVGALLGQHKYKAQSPEEQEAITATLITVLQSKPYLLVFDMLETCLTANEQGQHRFKEPIFEQFFSQILQAESMPSRVIITSQDELPVLAEGRYEERIHQELLTGLTVGEAIALFQQWQIEATTSTEADYLERIIAIYEGHPLALQVIAGEMSDAPFYGSIVAYWAEYGEEIERVEVMKADPQLEARTDQPRLDRYTVRLKDLVKQRVEKTFQRLYAANSIAGLLLCKNAVARIPTERKAWLFQIRAFPVEAQEAAFELLQRRFLINAVQHNDRVKYQLHSLIRRIALDALPQVEEIVQVPVKSL